MKNLKILVALRNNLFQQLDYGDHKHGGQEEKIRGLALHLRWTENDLRGLLKARAEAASQLYKLNPPKSLANMLPKANKGEDPVRRILSRTLMRPRDAILYLNEAVREASGKDRISWADIDRAEKRYSLERLSALRDEWKDPYLDIDHVLERFRRKPFRLNREQMTTVLDDIVLLLADPKFKGTPWLTEMCAPLYEVGSNDGTWFEWYGQLINLLYLLSFIGIAKAVHGKAIYSYERSGEVFHATDLPDSTYFEIHPAFRQALDIDAHPALS